MIFAHKVEDVDVGEMQGDGQKHLVCDWRREADISEVWAIRGYGNKTLHCAATHKNLERRGDGERGGGRGGGVNRARGCGEENLEAGS